MHMPGAVDLQYAAMQSMQAAQQTQAERRASAAVRRRLMAVGSDSVEDEVARVEAYAEGERQRQQQGQPPDEEAFRQIMISFNA